VAGEKATVGTTHKSHSVSVEVFLLEHPLYCKLDVLHILLAHIAGKGEDAVLAKTRGATIVHQEYCKTHLAKHGWEQHPGSDKG